MIRFSLSPARLLCLLALACIQTYAAATVHTLSFMSGNGSTDDTVGFSNALNAAGSGGTVIVDVPSNFYLINGTSGGGVCQTTAAVAITQAVTIQSSVVTTSAPGAPTGAPMFQTTNGNNLQYFFCTATNNVTISGLVFDSASAIVVNANAASARTVSNLVFTHNTVRNVTQAGAAQNTAAFQSYGILDHPNISWNYINNIWLGGFQANASYLFFNGCYQDQYGANGDGCDSQGGGLGFNYVNRGVIDWNKIDLVGNDAISFEGAGVQYQDGVQPADGGYTEIAYNEISRCKRFGIETVDGGSPNEDYSLIPYHNFVIKGNWWHDPAWVWWQIDAYSLVLDGAWNFQIYNNTASQNNTTNCFGGNIGDAFEYSGNSVLFQGNVANTSPDTCSSSNTWAGWLLLGNGKLQTIGTTGASDLIQNNVTCGPGGSAPNGTENSEVLGGSGSTNSTPGHPPMTIQGNSFSETCRFSDTAGSHISLAFTSPSNPTFSGSGTVNVGVTSNLSVRNVSFYVDGSSTAAVVQELSDYNASFSATNPQWNYHATINVSTLSNGPHTISAVATDVSGGTTTQQQGFTVNGGSGSNCAITTSSLPAGTVGVAYSTTLAQSGCGSGNWSIASGSLPTGLSLNVTTGVISGTPTVAGTSTVTIAFSTAVSTQPLSLLINPAVVNTCNTGTQNPNNGLYSDTFTGGCLGSWWTLQDIVGGATATVSGNAARISIPVGPPHDAYTNGDAAAVLRQNLLNNADFTVTAGFSSTPSQSAEGIQAIVSNSEFMRCEALWTPSGLETYSALINGSNVTVYSNAAYTGSAPFYLRLARTGSNFTCSVSGDGTNFSTVSSATASLHIAYVGATSDAGVVQGTNQEPAWTTVMTSWTVQQPAVCTASGTQNTSNGLFSDTFNAGCLGSWWTLQDPVGGATTSVGSGGLTISVPASTGGHDGFTSGDNTTVLTQPLSSNADFTVTAAFTTTPTQTFSEEGIQAIQDNDNYIRCEVGEEGGSGPNFNTDLITGSSGSDTFNNLISAAYGAGPPYYVRLQRTGSNFVCSVSHDGTTFTQSQAFTTTLNITKVGIADNTGPSGGSAPAFSETATSFTVAPPANKNQAFGGTPATFGPVTTTSTFLPEGQTAQLTSTVSGTWSLATGSVGTLTTFDSTDAQYVAPATIRPQHVSAGCMVQPNDSIFNTRIDSLPVSSHSSTWTNTTTTFGSDLFPPSSGVAFSFGADFARNIVDNTLPGTAENFVYTTAYNGKLWQIPPTPNRREHGTFAHTQGANDHHLISINRQTCQFYETYQDAMSSYSPLCSAGGCTAASGWQYGSTSYTMPQPASGSGGTTDAAGLPLAPLTLHSSEVLEAVRTGGSINHAMRFTTAPGFIGLNGSTAVWPATAASGGTDTSAPPIGTRFRLKSSFNTTGLISASVNNPNGTNHYTVNPTSITVTGCTSAPTLSVGMTGSQLTSIGITSPGSGCTAPLVTINGGTCSPCATASASTYSPYAQVILLGMQREGLIIADAGFPNEIIVDADMTSDKNTFLALQQIQGAAITMANMEAVDQTSFEVNSTSIEVAPSNSSGPAAQIVFTPTSGSPITSFPIALQAITVGTPFTHVAILAGESAYQFTAWVNGDQSNSGVTWSIASSSCTAGDCNCGTITPTGSYTPPATVTPGVSLTTTLVATSVADPTQSTGVYLTIYPAGTLRVDSGAATSFVDTSSNVWLPEQWGQAVEGMAYPFDDDTYDPNGLYGMMGWQHTSNIKLWQTGLHSLGGGSGGGDIYFSPIIVPNGTYDITFDFNLTGQNNGASSCWGSYNPSTQSIGAMSLVTQGIVQAHNWDPGLVTQNMCRQPASVDIPAIVSDRILRMTIGTDPTAFNESFLNAYSVAPFGGTAHWVIDTQQQTQIKPNNTLQMYIQDWGTGLNDPIWSVIQGPGTISSTGLYTAPPSQDITARTTIKACSGSQPSVCATTMLTVIGLKFPGFL